MRATEPATEPFPEVSDLRISRAVAISGQSRVFDAVSSSGTRVALKIFDRSWAESARTEAGVLRLCDSPHLARYVSHGRTTEGDPFIATAWTDGRTLATHAFDCAVPVRTAIRIVGQMACGLSELHRRGWVHCDLKAPNVLLGRDGTVVVIDFGLAVPVGTVVGRIRGTPQLCAPELYETRAITAAADVYALGMLLYLLVSGHVPYVAEKRLVDVASWSLEQWKDAHRHARPRRLDALVPHSLSSLIDRCLAKSPEGRPNTDALFFALANMTGPGGTSGSDHGET